MTAELSENLPEELTLALAHTAPNMRGPLRIFFELDARLARIVGSTHEPMLGQMRLAWWRDVLKQPIAQRPQGDAILDGIGRHWAGQEGVLVALVDAWEVMLGETLDTEAAAQFAAGRSKPFGALIAMAATGDAGKPDCGQGDMRWALADAATKVSNEEERSMLLNLAESQPASNYRYPRALRGVAVLTGLANRSINRGGRPLMEGRGAALTALRAAIFGQ